MNGEPRRPGDWDELPFRPAKATQWFAPSTLLEAGSRVLLSSSFGAFLDKRELQNAIQMAPAPPRTNPVDGVWIDFIADTGDGFDATYTVAWLAAQPELQFSDSGRSLPRAGVVVLGGDEVYPVASPAAYQHKFWGPYQAALPWLEGDQPALYAIPGNHDWYDGLTNFFRFFCQARDVGARTTCQKRSYFSVELPGNWWIWGIDIQLDSYIDQPQQDYFQGVPLLAGDKVILCTATPSWYDGPGHQGYNNLRYFEDNHISNRQARVVLSLSGDSHHYAHYRGSDGTHKVTAGGGGAFLHDTHSLAKTLPPDPRRPGQSFERGACYPDTGTSRRLALGAVNLPFRNPTFMIVPAVIYLIVAWSSQLALHPFGRTMPGGSGIRASGWHDIFLGIFRNPVSVLMFALLALGLFSFADPPEWIDRRIPKALTRFLLAAVHFALQVVAIVAVGVAAAHLAAWRWGGGWPFTFRLLIPVAVLGGVVGGLVTGLYLAIACAALTAHGNDAFSAMRIEGYKNFLRLHLDHTGALTVYPIGVAKANTKWEFDQDAAGRDASWIVPADGSAPVAHLIEDPFRVG